MPKYAFTALDLNNKKVSGEVVCRDENEFRRLMRGRNLYPVKFKIKDELARSYRLKTNELADFCRQLTGMLSAGITVVRAMGILKERDYKPPLKKVYEKMYADIQQGTEISEAMRNRGGSFPVLLINMFTSGEASGKLESVTNRMAEHYDKEHRLNGKIKSATRYPKIIGIITAIVVIIIFVFVLPNFLTLLDGVEIPAITQVVMAISDFMIYRWYVIIIAALLFVGIIRYGTQLTAVKLKVDKLKVKAPVVGKLMRTIYTARFARTLSSLYVSGVSMLQALEITGTIIMNKYIEAQFAGLINDVKNGQALSTAVAKIDGFDSKLSNTILIGEEAGRLDTMLVSTADSFEYEAEQATGALVQLSEPIIIVVLGGLIMLVLLSVMLPLVAMYEQF